MSRFEIPGIRAGETLKSDPGDPSAKLSYEANLSKQFKRAQAETHSPQELADAGIFQTCSLNSNSIFKRHGQVKYIVIHSTETSRPADAKQVISSWNRGPAHKGTQFVIDRDGTIYETADPNKRTAHVDNSRTVGGVHNDNSIGIELVHSGNEQYTDAQRMAAARLTAYLEARFHIDDKHVVGHGQIQPGNRHDPVNFDMNDLLRRKNNL